MMKPKTTLKQGNQKGAILITLIVSIVIISITYVGMSQFSTTSTYGELLANRQERAYYLAEAGVNYSRYKFNPDPTAPSYTNGPFSTPETFTLSNGQFTVKTYDKPGDTTRLIIESTGIVESGWLTTRQLVTKEISKAEVSGSTTIVGENGDVIPIAFNAVEPSAQELDSTWTVVPIVTEDKEIIVSNDGTLQFKDDMGAINLNTGLVDLETAVENNDGYLGYFLQVKLDASKMSPGNYFLLGISFRVQDANALNSYGLSYYRSNGSNGPKTWWDKPEFADFRNKLPMVQNDKFYVVLWKRVNGTYTVLAHTEINNTKCPGITSIINNQIKLSPWVTIVVRLKEDASGNRIRAYVQSPSVYPRGTVTWNFNNFKQITWTWPSATSEVADSTYTSAGFTNSRPEIGIHAYYDSSALGAQLFDDFGTIIQGLGGAGEQW